MSDAAQKRDIADPRTITQFAELVGSVERLRLLLVLTVADIWAVGPGIWNDWKGQLLRDLYRLTEAALHGGRSDEDGVRMRLAELANAAKDRLMQDLGRPEQGVLDDWLADNEDAYWINHDAEALLWHAREILRARRADADVHVAARPRSAQGVTEVLVYAPDRAGLFASLAASIAASGADIVSARVHTTRGGEAVDVFSIQSSQDRPYGLDDDEALANLMRRVHRAAKVDHAAPELQAPSRRTAAFTIEPWVRVDNTLTPSASVFEASGRDRPGLLAELARVFADAHVSIASAHIGAQGERVADVFYVQDAQGGQVRAADRLADLESKLVAVLRRGEPQAPADPAKNPMAVALSSTLR